MRTHELHQAPTVAAPVLPAAVKDHARAIAGESDTELTTDRLNILQACAEHVEKRAGRMFWPGIPAARQAVTIIEVHHCGEPIAACPLYQDTGGSDVTIASVERWDNDTSAWKVLAAGTDYRVRPVGRVSVQSRGDYRITASFVLSANAPQEAVEVVARMFASYEQHRPASGSAQGLDAEGRVANLDGLFRRSGADELLRQIRVGWPT